MSKHTVNDLNTMYTDVVTDYVKKGYKLTPMVAYLEGKFSDEIMHTDLYNAKVDKNHFIRVWLLKGNERLDKMTFSHVYTIELRVTKFDLHSNQTRWSDRGEWLSNRKFIKVEGRKSFCYVDSIEEYKEIDKLRVKRMDDSWVEKNPIKKLDLSKIPANVIDGIMRKVNSVYGCKRATASCIKEVRLGKNGYGQMTAEADWIFNTRSGRVTFR